MRTPAKMASGDNRPAHLKADRELINVASKLVAEVIERAKEEALKRRKSGAGPAQITASKEPSRQKLKTPQQSQEQQLQAPTKETESRTSSLSVTSSLHAQRLRGAYGNLTERLRTAYGSLAERLRNYRSPLERSRSGSAGGGSEPSAQ